MTQVEKYLLCKSKVLSSKPRTRKRERERLREREREREREKWGYRQHTAGRPCKDRGRR
jgi:hypothetical protein